MTPDNLAYQTWRNEAAIRKCLHQAERDLVEAQKMLYDEPAESFGELVARATDGVTLARAFIALRTVSEATP